MEEQFFRVAEELGWDVEQQIAVLEEFVGRFGAAGQLDDYLARRGLDGRHPRLRAATRDALLEFLATLGGAQGHVGRYLQGRLAEARQAEAATPETPTVAPPRASFWTRLLAHRPRAA